MFARSILYLHAEIEISLAQWALFGRDEVTYFQSWSIYARLEVAAADRTRTSITRRLASRVSRSTRTLRSSVEASIAFPPLALNSHCDLVLSLRVMAMACEWYSYILESFRGLLMTIEWTCHCWVLLNLATWMEQVAVLELSWISHPSPRRHWRLQQRLACCPAARRPAVPLPTRDLARRAQRPPPPPPPSRLAEHVLLNLQMSTSRRAASARSSVYSFGCICIPFYCSVLVPVAEWRMSLNF